MSLSDRVMRVQNQRHSSDEGLEDFGVDELRHEVQQILSPEKLVASMGDNPVQAKNELRKACREVLSRNSWAHLSELRKETLVNELIQSTFGMGPIEAFLQDETVSEIMINGANSIYIERGGVLQLTDQKFDNDEQVRVLIDRIIGPLGRRIDESSPMVSARLPQGHRVHAVIPPLALNGPTVTIRAFSKEILTLDAMVAKGTMESQTRTFLRQAVLRRKNIAVSGGTGSGKTTLLNSLSCHIPHGERVITIEDAAELKFKDHPHVVRLEARPRNAEGMGEVTIRELVINALRMRPDRIIVGECRSGEALDMLQAMNTGHEGSLTTLHANSPEDVIDRLVTMVRYVVDLPLDAIESQIGNGFDLIVQTIRAKDGSRFINAICQIDFDRDLRRCKIDTLYERDSAHEPGRWHSWPEWAKENSQALDSDFLEVL